MQLDVPKLIETPRYPGPYPRHDVQEKLLPSGVGKGSTGIGIKISKVLLLSDAHVVVTMSHCSQATAEYDQGIFQGFCSHGFALTVDLFINTSRMLRRLLTLFARMLGSISTTNSTVSP
jgi:hypothetical protein